MLGSSQVVRSHSPSRCASFLSVSPVVQVRSTDLRGRAEGLTAFTPREGLSARQPRLLLLVLGIRTADVFPGEAGAESFHMLIGIRVCARSAIDAFFWWLV